MCLGVTLLRHMCQPALRSAADSASRPDYFLHAGSNEPNAALGLVDLAINPTSHSASAATFSGHPDSMRMHRRVSAGGTPVGRAVCLVKTWRIQKVAAGTEHVVCSLARQRLILNGFVQPVMIFSSLPAGRVTDLGTAVGVVTCSW